MLNRGIFIIKLLYETFFDILNNFRDLSRKAKSHSTVRDGSFIII